MKLFAVFVGGNLPRANIELHDLRFVTGETIKDTVPQLRAAWWGTPASLHIDGYAELTHAEGRRIEIAPGPAPANADARLWFINVGGYTPELFGAAPLSLHGRRREARNLGPRPRPLAGLDQPPQGQPRHRR